MQVLKRAGRQAAWGILLACSGWISRADAGDCTIQFAALQQRMTGFGGSTADGFDAKPPRRSTMPDSLLNRLFSPTEGCGLTLVRMRIAPDATTLDNEIAIAKKAQDLGASIWAAPWSPPADYKDNNNVDNGGSLLASRYQDWADKLAAYAKDLQAKGIDLKWLSAQNEPQWKATYESCIYTPEQLTTFIGANLGPALEKAGLKTRIVGPEVMAWNTLKPFGDALLNNAAALKYLDVIATHQYGSSTPATEKFPYKLVLDKGKELWETEHGMDNYAGDTTMKGGIPLAKEMHIDIVQGPVSAYHVWWIIPGDGVNGRASNGLILGGKVCQRGYVMGNYSRFVRPGSYRIAATDNPTGGIYVTAYRNDSSGTLAIVAFNETSAAVNQKFALNGVNVPSVTPWETSDAVKLTARDSVTVAGGSFSWPIPGMSVITFVGKYPPTGSAVRKAPGAERPYREVQVGRQALTAQIRAAGEFTLAVYDVEGKCVGWYSGRGPGLCRVPLSGVRAGMYLVKFVAPGLRSFEEHVRVGR